MINAQPNPKPIVSTEDAQILARELVKVDYKNNLSNVGKIVEFSKERIDRSENIDSKLKELSKGVGIKKNPEKKSIMLPYAWHNGSLVPSKSVGISPASQGFMYGSSIFEGIRAFYDEKTGKTHIVGLKEHLERMQRGAKYSKMHLPSLEQMTKAIESMVKANHFEGDTYIRPFVYTNAEALGPMFVTNKVLDKEGNPIRTNESYTFGAIQMSLKNYVPQDGLRVLISPHQKISSDSVPAKVKYGGMYVFCSLAKGGAKEAGYDEAIVFNKDGTLAEGSSANAFIVKDNVIKTTGKGDNILVGITRDKVVELAKEFGYKVEVGPISKEEVLNADEVFLTGTATVVAPVLEIGEKGKKDTIIGNGKPGPVAKRLQLAYNGMARGDVNRLAA